MVNYFKEVLLKRANVLSLVEEVSVLSLAIITLFNEMNVVIEWRVQWGTSLYFYIFMKITSNISQKIATKHCSKYYTKLFSF